VGVHELEVLDGFTVTDAAVGFAVPEGVISSAAAINPKL
jgi:hypothetical protein